ncbi:MAG: TIGR00730 family Rossman fold protein [Verrucomicrobia bacterium]|nr:TIGR00730 family Rossman fold protein [Verrucomicrobiota bacterium]
MKSLCVYCSSSDRVDPCYAEAAVELGMLIGQRGLTLVYGGASVGLMGRLAVAVQRGGGRVVGVIPQSLRDREIAYESADELIVTRDLRERKAIMESRADAFVALPGGFGTLEEVLEVLTLKQLRTHEKPIVFLNTAGFYDRLLAVFEHLYEQRFTKADYRHSYSIATQPADVLHHLDHPRPAPDVTKW